MEGESQGAVRCRGLQSLPVPHGWLISARGKVTTQWRQDSPSLGDHMGRASLSRSRSGLPFQSLAVAFLQPAFPSRALLVSADQFCPSEAQATIGQCWLTAAPCWWATGTPAQHSTHTSLAATKHFLRAEGFPPSGILDAILQHLL